MLPANMRRHARPLHSGVPGKAPQKNRRRRRRRRRRKSDEEDDEDGLKKKKKLLNYWKLAETS